MGMVRTRARATANKKEVDEREEVLFMPKVLMLFFLVPGI
jgi:hypothetical protein